MVALGYSLLVPSLIIGFLAELRFLVVVYRTSTPWFLLCILVPLADLIYLALYPTYTWRPALLGYAMVLTALAGAWIADIGSI